MELSSVNRGLDLSVHAGGPTDLELALYGYLEEQGIDFIAEWNVPGTRYRVDAYDPATKIAYEADGPWHDRRRDRRRDRRIIATATVVQVRRLGYPELRAWIV